MTVNGTDGNDHYVGSNQSGDILRGAGGSDTLLGGDGDDILNGGAGADLLDGGEGNDIVSYYVEGATEGVVASLSEPIDGDTYISIEGLRGGLKSDRLTGNSADNTLEGGDGDDTLAGGGGEDTDVLIGEAGDDILLAGAGKDILWGGRQDRTGSTGWNRASYEDATGNIKLDLTKEDGSENTGWAKGDVYHDINGFIGSDFKDIMIGAEGMDAFYGGLGNDSLEGGAERDSLFGQAGNDIINGGAGDDTLDGGSGMDTAVFSGASSAYKISGDGTNATIVGADGTDVLKNVRLLKFGNGEVIALSNAAPTGLSLSKSFTVENAPIGAEVGDLAATDADGDKLTYSLASGSSSAFAIRDGNKLAVAGPLDFETQPSHQVTILANDGYGGSTSLTVTLTVGNAMETTPFTIRGTARADVLAGENGNDTIYGSLGNDMLTGHGGKDVFVFDTRLNKRSNVDKVMDFRTQDDSFYLDNKYFTKLGSGTFSKPKKLKADMFTEGKKAKDAEDRIVYDKKTGALYYDQDGTGTKAQVKIATISNKTKLYYHDFFVI